MDVSCSPDVADCRVEFLIAKPALMLLAPLEPSTYYYAAKPDRRADQASQEVRHLHKVAREAIPAKS